MLLLATVLVLALGMIVFAALASRRSKAGTPRVDGPRPRPGGGPSTTPPDGQGPTT